MNLKRIIFAHSLIFLFLVFSCGGSYRFSDVPLPQVKTISLSGEFCTQEETMSETEPVKIMFIVDVSGSMDDTDPLELRKTGVLNAIDKFDQYGNVYFAVSIFSSDKGYNKLLTDGFTQDPEQLTEEALSDLGYDSGGTPTTSALELARTTILSDIASIDDDLEKARTTYICVLFSDGMPNYGNDDWDTVKSEVLAATQNIADLKEPNGLADVIIHSAFLGESDGFDPEDYYQGRYGLSESEAFDEAVLLMNEIATIGNGTYTVFQNADQIDFIEIVAGSINIPYEIEEVIVSNLNSKIVENVFERMDDEIIVTSDTDGDGLSDLEEEVLGTSVKKKDTDGDGISDFTEVKDGMNPKVNDYTCSFSTSLDRDGDGVSDCEEVYLGTNYFDYDTDDDLMPDGIEVYNGLDPTNALDANEDADGDGISNYDEIKKHTNPSLADKDLHFTLKYRYEWEKTQTSLDGYSCYNITVENIGISETYQLSGESSPLNKIEVDILLKSTVDGQNKKLLNLGSFNVEFDKPEDVDGNVYRIEDIDFSSY